MQELDDSSQQVTNADSVTLFVRKWNPSQITLGPFQELTINRKFEKKCLFTLFKINLNRFFILANDEFKSLISKLSGIPQENVEFGKVL